MSTIMEHLGRRYLANCFTQTELSFLSHDDRFVNASASVETLDDGLAVARIGEGLLRKAWVEAAKKSWPGSR